MTERGSRLHATADGQIAELIALLPTIDEATLRLPCPGREKLGDGTVGASVRHTVDNYQRIAAFLLRAIGHGPTDDTEHNPGAGQRDAQYTTDNIDQAVVVEQISAARDSLNRLAELTGGQLDATPPDGSFRFCDGQRTLEQVLAGLFKHQGHQLEALRTALA